MHDWLVWACLVVSLPSPSSCRDWSRNSCFIGALNTHLFCVVAGQCGKMLYLESDISELRSTSGRCCWTEGLVCHCWWLWWLWVVLSFTAGHTQIHKRIYHVCPRRTGNQSRRVAVKDTVFDCIMLLYGWAVTIKYNFIICILLIVLIIFFYFCYM